MFAGAFEFVLFLETAEEASSGPKVGDCNVLKRVSSVIEKTILTACGHRNASPSNNNNLLTLRQNLQ